MLFISVLINTSCSDDNDSHKGLEQGTATLTVSIADEPALRYVGPSSTNPAVEGVISNLTVMVFNFLSGDVERVESFPLSAGDYTRQVTGLSTGTEKRVVVFVNVPDGVDFTTITTYDQLNTNLITLDSQNSADLATTGLLMSGETTNALILSPTEANAVTIPVSRRVAKIVLQSLIIQPDIPADLPIFTLTGVSVQKARLTGTPLGGLVNPTGEAVTNYAGGIASPAGATTNFNLIRDYLLNPLTLPAGYTAGTDVIASENQERYFYVLPNNGVDGNPTMLVLAGTFGTIPEPAYYPFVINGTTGQGNSDGNFIESNKIYAISATLRRINLPSEDPNVLPTDVVLDVTITPQNWTTRINQPVEW